MKSLILVKRGSTFFKLATFFIMVNIALSFVEIRTVTRSKTDELNSTLFVLGAMMSSFLALAMIYFARFYKIREVKSVQDDLIKTRTSKPKSLNKEVVSQPLNLH